MHTVYSTSLKSSNHSFSDHFYITSTSWELKGYIINKLVILNLIV